VKGPVYDHKGRTNVQPLNITSYHNNKHVCCIENILTFPTHSSITVEKCTHADITIFTQKFTPEVMT
jgi:hypothetical protein